MSDQKKLYKNIHTGEVLTLDHIEVFERNYPHPIKVYVFENGDRWSEKDLNERFVKVDEE